MWKFQKGIVVREKFGRYWGHVVGFAHMIDGSTEIVVELEDGSRSSYSPKDLETEVDQ